MKALSKTLLVILLIATFSVPAFTQETRWKELNEHVVSLYQQGRYSEAAQVAEEALKVAENTFGPDHQQVGTSLNNLAALYQAQGEYAEAEPLYKRALAIREKSLGPEHPDVATILRNMAEYYKKTGKKKEAKRLEIRAKIIETKNLLR